MQLSKNEKLLLISRVAEKLWKNFEENSDFEQQISEMAMDSDIQRELKEIEADFLHPEFYGLEKWFTARFSSAPAGKVESNTLQKIEDAVRPCLGLWKKNF